MADHHKRFSTWKERLGENSRYLVDQVCAVLLPEFEKHGFVWYGDFAGGKVSEVAANEIPLQRRTGENWPTVQLWFDKRGCPFFCISFAELPKICRKEFGTQEIPREEAIIAYAPAFFSLVRNGRGDIGMFGYSRFSLFPKRKLDSEIKRALGMIQILFPLFERGIPTEWLYKEPGMVAANILLNSSWETDERRRNRQRLEK